MRSIVKVSNIFVDDLFKWLYDTVKDAGGDGTGFIVCKNYKDVYGMFKKYIQSNDKYFADFATYENQTYISYYYDQEAFIFTDNIDITSFCNEYVFIVEGDCVGGCNHRDWKVEAICKQ